MNGEMINKVIKKVKKGHKTSFETLINHFGRNVHGYIFSLTRDREMTDDLYQEVWLKVYTKIEQYDGYHTFSAWLITLTKNTVYDHFKRSKVIQFPIHQVEEIVDVSETPEETVLKKERVVYLSECLDKLNDYDRELLLMRYFEDLTYDEICARLDINKKTLKWQLYEAKKRLKKTSDRKEASYGM